MTEPRPELTVWDSSDPPEDGCGAVLSWSGYGEGGAVRSLLRYVEDHGDRLRRRYLGWVYDLGASRVSGVSLRERLCFPYGPSRWWLSLFVEKSPWKSPSIVDVVRLLALEEIVTEECPASLCLVSPNRRLDAVLADFCQGAGIEYRWRRIPENAERGARGRRRLFDRLPRRIQALVSVGNYVLKQWGLRRARPFPWEARSNAIFLCSYFYNVDVGATPRGRFCSHYWTGLPDLLARAGIPSNWLHLFVPSKSAPEADTAAAWAEAHHAAPSADGCHGFLGAYLTSDRLRAALSAYLETGRRVRDWAGSRNAFTPEGSRMWLWPVVRDDWAESFTGSTALYGALWVELFEVAIGGLRRQRLGLFLFEGQPWERALAHAWREHGHGELIGVAHSTVRFWDLRCYQDPRGFDARGGGDVPRADRIAVNGDIAVDLLVEAGTPREQIVEVEALRYGHLSLAGDPRPPREVRQELRVLVLGDHVPSSTTRMLRMIEAAAAAHPGPWTFSVKPHPLFPVDSTDFPGLDLDVVSAPLGQVLRHFDVAISGNGTSAGVDAFLSGLPVLVLLNDGELNTSPLRGLAGVRFVATAEEIIHALRAAAADTPDPRSTSFFHLDPELGRWARLLSTSGGPVPSPSPGGRSYS